MAGVDRGVWRAIGYGVFITAAVVFAAAMTVLVFPRTLALVTDSVGVDGTVVGAPEPDRCGETSCFYADVRYPDATGTQWVKRMRVPGDAVPGTPIAVRVPRSNPADAATGGAFVVWIWLVFAVALGPILLIGAGRAALTAAVRRIRSIGEAG